MSTQGEPNRPAWEALDTVCAIGILVLMALVAFVGGCATAPPPCDDGLIVSPYSGVCAAEGTDAWYGDDGQAPTAPDEVQQDTAAIPQPLIV